MCNVDVEHLIHLFFGCPIALSYWNVAGLTYDMHEVTSAPQWILHKLEAASHEKITKIPVVL